MEDFKSSNWHSMEIGGWFGYIGNFPVSVRGGVGLLAASTVTFLNWFFIDFKDCSRCAEVATSPAKRSKRGAGDRGLTILSSPVHNKSIISKQNHCENNTKTTVIKPSLSLGIAKLEHGMD